MAGVDHKNWPWYPKDVGAYRGGTRGFSVQQHGAYNLLMDEYYHTGKALPSDPEVLARICGAVSPEERAAIDFVLNAKFERRGDRWFHSRIEEELDKRRQLSSARKAAAMGRWRGTRAAGTE